MSDKTEKATPKKLRKAREDGDSGASTVLSQSIAFAAAVMVVPLALADTWDTASAMLRQAMQLNSPSAWPHLLASFLRLSLPVLLVSAVVSASLTLVQTSGTFSTGRLAPKGERIDIIRGLRNLISAQRVVSVVRAVAYAAIVSWLTTTALLSNASLVFVFGVGPVLSAVARIGLPILRNAAWVGIFFGFVDLWVTLRARNDRLRMTKDEVRREHRESEGDPQMKAARRRAHQEVLAQSILADVRRAAVVVVNPTHLACALRYNETDGDTAPIVLAAGAGDFARRIVTEAYAHGVPVLQNIAVARAIYELEIGSEIPEALYEAVAEVLRLALEEEETSRTERSTEDPQSQRQSGKSLAGIRG